MKRLKSVPAKSKANLERVIGHTCDRPSALTVNGVSGHIAYICGSIISLHDPQKNKQVRFLVSKRNRPFLCATFSPDGKHLAAGEKGKDPSIFVWDLETLTHAAELKGHHFDIQTVAFSHDGSLLVSIGHAQDGNVFLWDTKPTSSGGVGAHSSSSSRSTVPLAKGRVSGATHRAAFSPCGTAFVTCGVRSVRFWSLEGIIGKGKRGHVRTAKLTGRSATFGSGGDSSRFKDDTFNDLAFGVGNDGKHVYAVTESGCLCCFVLTRQMKSWVFLKGGASHSISVNASKIVCGCSNGVLRIFKPSTLDFLSTLPKPAPLGRHNVGIVSTGASMLKPPVVGDLIFPDCKAVQLSKSGSERLICVYSDRSMFLWDIEDLSKVGKYRSTLSHASGIWDVRGIPQSLSSMPTLPLERVDLSPIEGPLLPPGSFATCSDDGTVRLWNLNGYALIDPAGAAVGESLIQRNVYCKELMRVLEPQEPNGDQAAKEEPIAIRCISVSEDGIMLACGDREGNVTVFDLRTFERVVRLEAHEAEVLGIAFSAQGLLATASRDRLVHVFDTKDGFKLLQTLDEHSSSVTSVLFTSDGERLITCGADKSIFFRRRDINGVYSGYTQTVVPYGTIYGMTLDASGKFALAGGEDKKLYVVSVDTGKIIRRYKTDAKAGESLRIELDPSGLYAAVSSSDRQIRLYDFISGQLLGKIRGHAEVVTGIMFTPDCHRIVSVSGDGCVFVWRIAPTLSKSMKARLVEMEESKKVKERRVSQPSSDVEHKGTEEEHHVSADVRDDVDDGALSRRHRHHEDDVIVAGIAVGKGPPAIQKQPSLPDLPPSPSHGSTPIYQSSEEFQRNVDHLHQILDAALRDSSGNLLPDVSDGSEKGGKEIKDGGKNVRSAFDMEDPSEMFAFNETALPSWAKARPVEVPKSKVEDQKLRSSRPISARGKWLDRLESEGYKVFGEDGKGGPIVVDSRTQQRYTLTPDADLSTDDVRASLVPYVARGRHSGIVVEDVAEDDETENRELPLSLSQSPPAESLLAQERSRLRAEGLKEKEVATSCSTEGEKKEQSGKEVSDDGKVEREKDVEEKKETREVENEHEVESEGENEDEEDEDVFIAGPLEEDTDEFVDEVDDDTVEESIILDEGDEFRGEVVDHSGAQDGEDGDVLYSEDDDEKEEALSSTSNVDVPVSSLHSPMKRQEKPPKEVDAGNDDSADVPRFEMSPSPEPDLLDEEFHSLGQRVVMASRLRKSGKRDSFSRTSISSRFLQGRHEELSKALQDAAEEEDAARAKEKALREETDRSDEVVEFSKLSVGGKGDMKLSPKSSEESEQSGERKETEETVSGDGAGERRDQKELEGRKEVEDARLRDSISLVANRETSRLERRKEQLAREVQRTRQRLRELGLLVEPKEFAPQRLEESPPPPLPLPLPLPRLTLGRKGKAEEKKDQKTLPEQQQELPLKHPSSVENVGAPEDEDRVTPPLPASPRESSDVFSTLRTLRGPIQDHKEEETSKETDSLEEERKELDESKVEEKAETVDAGENGEMKKSNLISAEQQPIVEVDHKDDATMEKYEEEKVEGKVDVLDVKEANEQPLTESDDMAIESEKTDVIQDAQQVLKEETEGATKKELHPPEPSKSVQYAPKDGPRAEAPVNRSCLPRSLQDYRASIVHLKRALEDTMTMFNEVRDVVQQSVVAAPSGDEDEHDEENEHEDGRRDVHVGGDDAMLLMDVYKSLFSHIHRKIYSFPEGRESVQEVSRSHRVHIPTEPEMHTVLEEYSSKLLSMFQQKLSQSMQMSGAPQPHQGEDGTRKK